MSIADIIRQIDAHILRLREARDLLLVAGPTARPTRTRHVNPKIEAGKTVPSSTSKPETRASKPRSNLALPRKMVKEPVESSLPIQKSPAGQIVNTEPTPIAISEAPPPQNTDTAMLLSQEPPLPDKSARHRTRKPAFESKPEVLKPAGALARPMNSRIVVVSAEQARQEREQIKNRAVQSKIQRPRVPGSGLTGRVAFEALFKDTPDPSKPSDP